MGNTLIRSSFSTNIKERKDCSVALFDAAGRLIAQASHIPFFGSLLGSVQAVLAHAPVATMRDGDAFICNDPYRANGTHMLIHLGRDARVRGRRCAVLRR